MDFSELVDELEEELDEDLKGDHRRSCLGTWRDSLWGSECWTWSLRSLQLQNKKYDIGQVPEVVYF